MTTETNCILSGYIKQLHTYINVYIGREKEGVSEKGREGEKKEREGVKEEEEREKVSTLSCMN